MPVLAIRIDLQMDSLDTVTVYGSKAVAVAG